MTIKESFQLNKVTGTYDFKNKMIKFTDKKKKNGEYYQNGVLIYQGNLKNFKPNGDGKLYNSSGVFFEGKFKNGDRHGKGKIVSPNGIISMEGIWKNNQKSGKFIIFNGNGEIERVTKFEKDKEISCPEGTIRNPKTGNCVKQKNAKAKDDYIQNPSTGLYEKGNISVKKINKNEGIISVCGVKYYSGKLHNFKPDGFGTFYSNGIAHYTGFTKDGKNHGKGKYLRPDGSTSIEGVWNNGKLNGKIKFIKENGEIRIVPFKNDVIVNCPDGKEINYKTGNCVKAKKKQPEVKQENNKLYDKIIKSFCHEPFDQQNWYMLDINDTILECLLFIVENSSAVSIPEVSSSKDNKIQIIIDKIKLFYLTHTLDSESRKQIEERFKKGVDGITLRDVGAFAEMFKIWIFFYSEETETKKGQWILPPKTFYNYKPKQVFFISFSREGNEKNFSSYHLYQPKKIPTSMEALFFNIEVIRKKYPHMNIMYPTEKLKKINEMYNKIRDTLESRPPFIKPTPPDSEDEIALIHHLRNFTMSNLSESISYQIFQWLKPFCKKHQCWVYLYHQQKTEFAASSMDEPFQKIFFVYKRSDFDTPKEKWGENEFQICCRYKPTSNKIIQSWMRECSFIANKQKIPQAKNKSQAPKKTKKKLTAFDRLRMKFKKKMK